LKRKPSNVERDRAKNFAGVSKEVIKKDAGKRLKAIIIVCRKKGGGCGAQREHFFLGKIARQRKNSLYIRKGKRERRPKVVKRKVGSKGYGVGGLKLLTKKSLLYNEDGV